MKKIHAGLALCLLLALVCFSATPNAQVAPENNAMAGEGLNEATDEFVAALKTEDYTAMFDSLASWKQNVVGLSQERLNEKIESDELTEATASAWIAKQDPTGELGIKTRDELKAALPAKFFALKSGMAVLLTSEMRKKNRLTWYVVERQVGLIQARSSRMNILPWGGLVVYENSAKDTLTFTLAIEKGKWKVTDFAIKVGKGKLEFASALEQEVDGPRVWSSMEEARAAEGEQLLGAARDACRVEYAKTGSVDSVTKGFNRYVADGNFDGEYYEVKKYIKELPGSDYDAAVTAHPKTESDPWLLIKFKWASGNSDIIWFDDKAAMEAEVSKLTEEVK